MVAGAGFVVFRRFGEQLLFLGLVGPHMHRTRCNGTYDVPKGTIDPGESALDTAIREAYEEASYSIELKNIVAGPFIDGMLTMWLAEVYSDPVLGVNPVNGIIEHEGFKWLTAQQLEYDCYDYLYPSISWATKQASNMYP